VVDLSLELGDGPRTAGLCRALREAVVSGRLAPGALLPSTRALAVDLGLSRATVVDAYEQLVAEGYLLAHQGAGTVVADVRLRLPTASAGDLRQPSQEAGRSGRTGAAATTARAGRTGVAATAHAAPTALFTELLPGEPDHSAFPRRAWLASLRQVLTAEPDGLFGYGDHRGLPGLRAELARYLSRTRAVPAEPDRIVVLPGYSCALAVLAEAMAGAGVRTVAVEDPCLPRHAEALVAAGLIVRAVRVDGDGLVVDELTDADAVVCTPSHQYPMGAALAPERRAALVAWARARDAWIVEDDYDGEFRYDRGPVGALAGLGQERVVYAGTASKSLAPGLAVAWLVLPQALVEPVLAVRRRLRPAVSTIEQAALADFIAGGRLDRHVRRMRTVYRRRRDAMVELLAPRFEVVGIAAGLHVTALTDDEARFVERALAQGVALFGIGHHRPRASATAVGAAGADDAVAASGTVARGLVIGYSRSPAHGYPAALERLAKVLGPGG
jgi:GntR family transcriptional regulator/MocR family aminotransferase